MKLLAGHVVRISDRQTNPPNQIKRHLCVHPARRLFLRINTNSYWPTCHLLEVRNNPGILDWDSYVELHQLCRFGPDEVSRALARHDAVLGRMSASEANAVAWAARHSPALTEEYQQLVWDNLSDLG